MANTEDSESKVPGSTPTTTEHNSGTATGTNSVDDGKKKPHELHDDTESSSVKRVAAAAAETTTTTKVKTTTDSAAIDNSSSSTTMATADITEKPAANTTIAVATSTTPSKATEVTDTVALEDGNSNEKRKALGDDQSPSPSKKPTEVVAAATAIPTRTTVQENNNVSVEKNVNNSTASCDDSEAPPTKKRGRGRPRKSEQGPGSSKKRTRDNNNNKRENGKNKIVYYAIRPGNGPVPIENPIIFFGYKEFDFFHKSCFNPTIIARNGGVTPLLSYRVCDSLADALAYVGAETYDHDPATMSGRRIGESGVSTRASTRSNKQRKLNHPPIPQAVAQQQMATAHLAATAQAAQQHQLQQMVLRQQQQIMVVAQAQRQQIFAAQIAATAAQQQRQLVMQQQQQQLVAAQAAAAKQLDQQDHVVDATPNNLAVGQPTNGNASQKAPETSPVAQQQPTITAQVAPAAQQDQMGVAQTTPQRRATRQQHQQQQQQKQPAVQKKAPSPQPPNNTTRSPNFANTQVGQCSQLVGAVTRRRKSAAAAVSNVPFPPVATTLAKSRKTKRGVAASEQAPFVTLPNINFPSPAATTNTSPAAAINVRNSQAPAPAPAVTVKYTRWNKRFELLREYKEEYGNCDVRLFRASDPEYKEKYKKLQPWVCAQREQLKLFSEDPNNGKLTITPDQRDRLMDLGFVVDVEDFRWHQTFDLLREYKEEHGDCDIFKAMEQQTLADKYKHLVPWGKKQQQMIKKIDDNEDLSTETSTESAERRKLLLDLGLPTLRTKQQLLEAQRARAVKSFHDKVEELKAYKEEHGNCDVKLLGSSAEYKEKYKNLCVWVNTQRDQLKLLSEDPTNAKLTLTPDQRDRLMDVGFVVDVDDFRWNEKFDLLREYKEEHGDCNILKRKDEQPLVEKYQPLQYWSRKQQELIKQFDENEDPSLPVSTMTAERRRRLVDLGFPILLTEQQRREAAKARFDKIFEERIEELKAYKEEYGNCDVRLVNIPEPNDKDKYKNLVLWVSAMREQLKLLLEDTASEKSKLSTEQQDRLMDLGFIVDAEDFRWNERFDLLREYKEENGDCNVFPTKEQQPLTEKYKPLVNWCRKQQQLIRCLDENGDPSSISTTTKMNAERRKLLVDLGLPVVKATSEEIFDAGFMKKVAQLKAYKEEHGTTVLPSGSTIRIWLCSRRRDYAALQQGKPSPLKLEHIVALTSLGFSLTPDHRPRKSIQERVMEYVEFVKKNGRFPDPRSKDPDECVLGSSAVKWSYRRRLHAQGILKAPKYGKTEIPQDLIDALDSVNFRWEAKDLNLANKKIKQIPWDERFEMLKKYKEKHGHCEPPKRHPKVGLFAFRIRQNYKFMIQNKKSNLTVERFRKLSEIGFRFKTASVAGVENKRQRFVDNDSSGYDTTSDEDNNEAEAEEEENTNRNLRRIGKGYRRNRDDEDNESVGTDDGGNNRRSGNADNGKTNRDNNDQPPTGAASILNNMNGQWVPDDCMWD